MYPFLTSRPYHKYWAGTMTLAALALLIGTHSCLQSASGSEEPVFSGPQPGEELRPFKARWAYGENAGKDFVVIDESDRKPTVLIFVHQMTRPSIGLTRAVMNFAEKKEPTNLKRHIVFLAKDATEMETRLKRARHALPHQVPVGISVDGEEGPGAYGLNRNVALTVLIANQGKVTANFALVQPSLTDAPEIGLAIEKLFGRDNKPSLVEMGVNPQGMRRPASQNGNPDPTLFRSMMAPVIRKTATKSDVEKAARAVEDLAEKDKAFRQKVAEVANRIIEAGRLEMYGTPAAQEYLRKWAKEFKSPESKDAATGESDSARASEADSEKSKRSEDQTDS